MSTRPRRSTAWLIGALALVGGIAAVAWAAWSNWREEPRWTTESAEAAAEYERGVEAAMKFYEEEAYEHFERALELDPTFAMARLRLVRFQRERDKEAFKENLEALKAVDPETLNPRERFLLAYGIARQDRENAHADKLLTAYLDQHPDDPFALRVRCGQFFERRDWEAADACNRRLLKVDPNWVEAQNQLGYIAMAQGRFDDAEELFRTYLYIAPDQANPHDSIGELLTVRGRYAAAQASLEKALEIKPDFCGSWSHLILVHQLRGDLAAAQQTLGRMREEERCDERRLLRDACRLESWSAYARGDLAAAWRLPAERGCMEEEGATSLLAYRAALIAGLGAEARPWMEKQLKDAKVYAEEGDAMTAIAAHLDGLDAYMGRDYAKAVERFRTADQSLVYWSDGEAIFKLFNRLDLASAARANGDAATAAEMEAAVRAVNPELATRTAPFALPAAAASGPQRP